MTQVGCAPTWPIDGPPPSPPWFTLLDAARVLEDVDAAQIERWQNGVKVYPFPPGPAAAWDANAVGSQMVAKGEGTPVELPDFSPLTVYLAESCSTGGIWGGGLSPEQAQDRFVSRATKALDAVESAALEAEFMGGDALGNNPHLGDGNGDFLNGSAVTSLVNAIALLENAIAATGKAGFIHLSPAAALTASGKHVLWRDDRGPGGAPVLRTVNGTVVIPGYGYVGQSKPDGKNAPTGTQEWIYATGPVEIRRSAPFVLPGTVGEALNRSINKIVYRVERYYVVDWDVQLQAAVLADRCMETCS